MNTSLLSYTQKAYERSTIGENNLRLNIFANILLISANVFLFYLDWFHFETLMSSKDAIGGASPMSVFISILSVRIEPAQTVIDTSDFLSQCEALTASGSVEVSEACNIVRNMSRCFTAFMVFMVLQLVFNLHTLITMYLIVKKRI